MDNENHSINNDMKATFKIVSLLLALTLLVGCANFLTETSTTGQTVQAYLPYIEPTVSLATSSVFAFAVNAKDRADKALVIYNVSGVVDTLSKGEPLSPEEFEKALEGITPNKEHWSQFVVTIASVYSSVYYRVSGDAKVALQTLSAIARGLRSGVLPYIKDDFKQILVPDSL
jgi:hypothetical protein